MAGDPVTPAAKNSSDNARVVRRRVSKFSTADKENFNVYGGNVGENQKKSPLPVGYPRRPLHDITAVLQSFDDQDEASTRPHKHFTRSQMGLCSRNYELIETSSSTKNGAGSSSKESKGKSVKQTATTTTTSTKRTKSVLPVDLQIHDRENQDPGINVILEKKVKSVRFAEVECTSENANVEMPLPVLPHVSKDEALFGGFETGAEEAFANLREDNDTVIVAETSAEGSQRELKSETSSRSSMDVAIETSAQVSNAKPMEAESSTANRRTRYQHLQEQKMQKPLSSRSSVVKFR
ncbi:hypothetical protein MPTK1_1g05990 [Marchantia polymorpha subsp. ruderalis]|uniref:Uncharacterized protein n=2 Tax=Marchantia polymorpha TaxID=3197 RepID=A0A176WEC8_MARPO|nr:hypothetical protein AXG93_3016s1070 [Marchantia polymorpha subsp. ruderalis]PTQ48329.1 hypothetical protein MARPO_0005s0010 [Marchantia polymorpha]BBM97476.1 hypothetical protein Mp_1g05990 [Marchantia polymorpha subsp. ruderalis]|eukprot:PTQ48329.1 hypothetical protein MARPO_0005s0010 [Marchantia polymorpha]